MTAKMRQVVFFVRGVVQGFEANAPRLSEGQRAEMAEHALALISKRISEAINAEAGK